MPEYKLPYPTAYLLMNPRCNKRYLIAIHQFIIAINDSDHKIDDYWKAFNAIYALNSNGKEKTQLHDMATLIKSDRHLPGQSSLSLAYLMDHYDELFHSIGWWTYLNNVFERQELKDNSLEGKKEFQEGLVSLLRNKDPYIQEKLVSALLSGLKRKPPTASFMKLEYDWKLDPEKLKTAASGEHDYREILAFIATQYIYKLRCSYFHAEKACPVVLSRSNDETRKNQYFCELLARLIADMLKANIIYRKAKSRH